METSLFFEMKTEKELEKETGKTGSEEDGNTNFHRLANVDSFVPLPDKFTFPFQYTPHPLCMVAAEELKVYLAAQSAWQEELQQGKMFGVLLVQTETGRIGYLAAFSGLLDGSNRHAFFVPPVYDLLRPDGFFRQEEEQISALHARVNRLLADPAFLLLSRELAEAEAEATCELTEAKTALKQAKAARDARRRSCSEPDEAEELSLIGESQFQKAEYKRLERRWKERIALLQTAVAGYQAEIERLKTERKQRSAALQRRLFEQFKIRNARGECTDLATLFEATAQQPPPAGAGECAAPKLLQYAYVRQWKPLAMAEFWWGDSPKTEVRRHGYYYPACKGKCGPILKYMLQGLEVDPDPLLQSVYPEMPLEILFEDEWVVVVNKPAGLLATPGKIGVDSLYDRLKAHYPTATGPLLVHRLDMATSGVLLVAKTKIAHQHLQAQFKNRTVRKRYIALLDGRVDPEEGTIDLPLCVNPLDRPRQQVDPVRGKPAVTFYRVLERASGRTRVAFYPHTGRTHQLRVHAAHTLGLHCPIVGDELYGKKSDRLYLHAEWIEFTHPVTGRRIAVEKKAPF